MFNFAREKKNSFGFILFGSVLFCFVVLPHTLQNANRNAAQLFLFFSLLKTFNIGRVKIFRILYLHRAEFSRSEKKDGQHLWDHLVNSGDTTTEATEEKEH